jgi:hypothetical protein
MCSFDWRKTARYKTTTFFIKKTLLKRKSRYGAVFFLCALKRWLELKIEGPQKFAQKHAERQVVTENK